MQKETSNDNHKPEEPGFLHTLQSLPKPLANKFLKYSMATALSLLVVIIILFATKAVVYCWGFAFPVFFLYLSLSLVWDWAEARIQCNRMLCIKASRQSGEQLYLILKNIDRDADLPDEIHKFHVPIGKKEAILFSENTILEVYYNPRNIGEMVAWEIVGNLTAH